MITSRDGTGIAWHQAGTGSPVVLVHGAAGDRGNWIACTPHLGPRHTLYTVDRRGRGRSGDGPGYAIEPEYEDVAAVVEHAARRAGGPVALVCHSYGAVVALGALGLTGEVDRVVLYEPPLLMAGAADPEGLAARIDDEVAAGDRSGAVEEFLRATGATAGEIGRLRGFVRARAQLCRDVHTVPRELRSLVSLPTAFGHVTQPALLPVGERSPGYLRASAEHLLATLPAARLVELPGQGHFAPQNDAERFCAEVLAFLDRA